MLWGARRERNEKTTAAATPTAKKKQMDIINDDIVDWTERNPFGEYGNHLGSL